MTTPPQDVKNVLTFMAFSLGVEAGVPRRTLKTPQGCLLFVPEGALAPFCRIAGTLLHRQVAARALSADGRAPRGDEARNNCYLRIPAGWNRREADIKGGTEGAVVAGETDQSSPALKLPSGGR